LVEVEDLDKARSTSPRRRVFDEQMWDDEKDALNKPGDELRAAERGESDKRERSRAAPPPTAADERAAPAVR
jgi:hypothetical protein